MARWLAKGLEIAWVADRAELFFLQVQGSGRLRAPDGTVIRLGYAGQNGYTYTGIGSVMRFARIDRLRAGPVSRIDAGHLALSP